MKLCNRKNEKQKTKRKINFICVMWLENEFIFDRTKIFVFLYICQASIRNMLKIEIYSWKLGKRKILEKEYLHSEFSEHPAVVA